MIIADIVPQNENLFFVRFSDPNEDFGNKPYFIVQSIQEAKRRMYFRNRIYITEKMVSWLKQRLHANPTLQSEITPLIHCMTGMEKMSLTYICNFIKNKRKAFEKAAPAESSKCFKYYSEVVVPILDFSAGWDNTSS